MLRTSLSVHAPPDAGPAVRQKREAIADATNQDAWLKDITEQSMLAVADPQTEPKPSTPAPTNPPHRPSEATGNHPPSQKTAANFSDRGF